MASFNAIAAVSRAILYVLESAPPPSEFGSLEYKLYHAGNFDETHIDRGFSLYLWRVSVNGARRNLPPRRLPDGRAFRPSLPVDLHYLLTPWAADAELQQRLMGWAMRRLEDNAVLPPGILNHNSEPDTFAANEAVELFCDPLALTDLYSLWDKLKPWLQTSMTYQVRTVLIDSQQLSPEYDVVQRRELQAAGVGV